jgi:6-phosphogluconolactonase
MSLLYIGTYTGKNSKGIYACRFDAATGGGALHELQTISTLPKSFQGDNSAAELEVDRAGKFLYCSNRGHDSIAIFAINPGPATLAPLKYVSAQGKVPRHFAIAPTRSHLLVANQDSNNVVVFQVGAESGFLTPSGQALEAPSPVCLRFVTTE